MSGAARKLVQSRALQAFYSLPDCESTTWQSALGAFSTSSIMKKFETNSFFGEYASSNLAVVPDFEASKALYCDAHTIARNFTFPHAILDLGTRANHVQATEPEHGRYQVKNFENSAVPLFYRSAHFPKCRQGSLTATEAINAHLLLGILINVAKPSRYEAPLEHNADMSADFEFLPHTTDITSQIDEKDVAMLESRHQCDAILLDLDFRAALRTLTQEELFGTSELTQIIGVTRAVLSTWRARPLEKIREANKGSMGRLLFAWKYWLHVTEGEQLGPYLRHVPDGCATSLLRLLADNEPTHEEIARNVERLAVYASHDRKASAIRRRDVGGLPDRANLREALFD